MGPHKPFLSQPMQKNLQEDTTTLDNVVYSIDFHNQFFKSNKCRHNNNSSNKNSIFLPRG